MSLTPEELLEEGIRARREQRHADARIHYAQAVDLCRRTNDQTHLAKALTGLGQIERDLGDLDSALICYEEAVSILRAQNDLLSLAHTIRHTGDILRNQGQLERAAPCYTEALEIYRTHPQTKPLDLANALWGFALLHGESGRADEAIQLWMEAENLYAEAGVQDGVEESKAQIKRLSGSY